MYMYLAKQGDNALGSIHPSALSCLDCVTYNLDIQYVG